MKIFPSSLSSLYIEWEITADTFNLYRSTSSTGTFRLVKEDIPTAFYLDEDVNLVASNVRYYYKVEGYVDGNKVGSEGPATLHYNEADHVANKVIHESKIALRMMKNPPVFFIHRKRKGDYCPDCWNTVTNRVSYSDCKTCNGTGYMQGYHAPIKTRISQDVSQLVLTSNDMDSDHVSLSPIRAWMMNVPLLYPNDIMVDRLNQRYKITQVQRRTRSQFVIRQILEMSPLDKGHPSYKVDVDWEADFYE